MVGIENIHLVGFIPLDPVGMGICVPSSRLNNWTHLILFENMNIE